MKNMYKRPHFFAFFGTATITEFWSSVFYSVIACFCTLMMLCVLVCVVIPGDVEKMKGIMNWVTIGNGAFWLVHLAALSRRRLRDGGYTAKSYLWLLLPVVGWIIFVFKRLCARSVDTV